MIIQGCSLLIVLQDFFPEKTLFFFKKSLFHLVFIDFVEELRVSRKLNS